MKTFDNIEALVGHTPLVALKRFAAFNNASAYLYAKLEALNPAGSVKDRVALMMIMSAEEKGLLKPGSVIIEPTSGNTGIGLAAIACSRGYQVVLTMPDSMSLERRKLLKAFGANLVLTPGALGMDGAIQKALELVAQTPNAFMPSQFENPDNPRAHYLSTGPEIYDDLDACVNAFVAGIGTGGTITGVGRYLKEKNPEIRIVGVEPVNSAVLSGKPKGPHGLQGIGAGFIPDALDTAIYDELILVSDEEAYAAGRILTKTEGLLCGITSGAALHAALQLAKRAEFENKNIVVLLPDRGERYLSTPLF